MTGGLGRRRRRGGRRFGGRRDRDLVRGRARLHARLGRGEEPLLLVGVEDHGAAEVRHVAAGQFGAFELRLAHPVEEDLVLADEDGVAVAQRPLRDLVAVHERPVGALEVLDDELRTLARDADVVRRHRRVVDHDRVVGQAADGHRGRVRHGRLLQHSTLEQKHQLGHVVGQFLSLPNRPACPNHAIAPADCPPLHGLGLAGSRLPARPERPGRVGRPGGGRARGRLKPARRIEGG